MFELVAGVVVAFAAVWLVLDPLLSGRAVRAAPGARQDEPDFTEPEESDSPKIQALLALKEIEFDRATGKLSDEDYAALKAKYAATALAAINQEEQQQVAVAEVVAGESVATAVDQAEELIRRIGQGRGSVCPACGPRPEADAVFCSSCGRTLAIPDSPARCPNCGAARRGDAKYCAACGAGLTP
ncbi:MAG: hypothetical protein GTN62_00885 [Gemmatimonadales bacterium]|nr:hypothetical protein [Gemmatimonadales bacterium]NIN48658.1 hypothetical protein [Gemmatimonadales bacterium]NIP06122.1 hypothetical protein [Gemmatimonadales bacterium]NIR01296.1 hypothetical protein [Gemmatimonadales bacterium]